MKETVKAGYPHDDMTRAADSSISTPEPYDEKTANAGVGKESAAKDDMYDEKRQTSISSRDSVQSSENVVKPGEKQRIGGASGDKDVSDEEEEVEEVDDEGRRDLERVVSSVPSANNVRSIPNGGLWAWLQVLGAFFLFFNSWGIVNAFGTYQAYYKTSLLTDSTPSSISWIGSIQAFLLMVVGALTGPLYDAGYFRHLLLGGSLLLIIGQMMLSLCTEYWQVLLAQAFCVGIGCGCLFVPSVAILNTYFTTRIATAMGLAASGSSFGGVIYPIAFRKLQPQIGFAWTTRTLGLIMLITQLIPIFCMRVRVLPPKKRSLLDLHAFTLPPYTLNILGLFTAFTGLYMPFFYASTYAIDNNITNPDLAFYLLAIMNSTSVFGRIIPNYIADRLGPFNVIVPFLLVSGVLCFCFVAVKSSASIITLVGFYGFFSGTVVSLPPTIIVSLSQDAREKIGTRLGQSFGCIAIGVLIGTPIGGAILNSRGFVSVWVFGGCLMVGGSVMLGAARVKFRGWRWNVKA